MLNSAKKANILQSKITDRIVKYGPITIADYMSLIAYDGDGYYQNHKIGCDFITSPQISKGFGGLIASWFFQIWEKYFYNQQIIFIELGAGNGDLILQMMKIFSQVPVLFDRMSVKIIENSDLLKKVQKEKLFTFSQKIEWINDIGLLEINKPVFLIANEFFDCLPIHQFFYQNDKLYEILAGIDDKKENLRFVLSEKLSNAHFLIEKSYLKNGNIIEVSPYSINLCRYINEILKKVSGISVIIDYGYTEFPGKSSLQGIYKHKVSNIFENIGEVDISAHVNFQSLADQMKNCETKIYSQNQFLNNLKIEKINSIDPYLYDDSEDSSMGKLFKVMYSRAL